MSIKDLIIREAQAQGVDPSLALGLATQESGMNQRAISPAGALGVMQLMPGTAQQMGVNPRNLEDNVKGGVKYLKQQLDKYKDVKKALAAYNAGPGNVDKYGGVPPFKETQKYVPAVLNFASQYGFKGMTPSQETVINQQQPASTQQPTIDPLSLLGVKPAKLSSGMRTLLSVLGTIGSLGGSAANLVSAFKGNPPTGNAALNQSSGLLEMLAQDQAGQDAYQQRAALATNPGLPPLLQSLGAAGGPQLVAKQLLEQADPAKALQIQKLQQDVAENTPEGQAAKAEREYKEFERRSKFQTKEYLERYGGMLDEKDQQKQERIDRLQKGLEQATLEGNTSNISVISAQLNKETGYKPLSENVPKLNAIKPLEDTLTQLQGIKRDAAQLTASLSQISTGPVSGRLAQLEAFLTGEGPVKLVDQAKALLLGPTARGLASEKGVLTDKDIDRVAKAFADPTMSPEARIRVMQELENKVNFTANLVFNRMQRISGDRNDPYLKDVEQRVMVNFLPTEAPIPKSPDNTTKSLREKYNY